MSKLSFEIFEDGAGQWRWRLRHDNGNIVADSGEGYATKSKAKQGIKAVKAGADEADVTEVK
ncbi:YegP family protein [Halolamina sp. CBA1230]|uniref:HVO_2922 family protein n=1 Tax=Halolamina sp. CBA1230 TaxID=1853690 RepID=UPI0009A178F8|nr:HVO_2922 family protein [Halolamina sp. CBA1230]QKY19706.1 YegP family protein [Halolamina sp. CBA1230]